MTTFEAATLTGGVVLTVVMLTAVAAAGGSALVILGMLAGVAVVLSVIGGGMQRWCRLVMWAALLTGGIATWMLDGGLRSVGGV